MPEVEQMEDEMHDLVADPDMEADLPEPETKNQLPTTKIKTPSKKPRTSSRSGSSSKSPSKKMNSKDLAIGRRFFEVDKVKEALFWYRFLRG